MEHHGFANDTRAISLMQKAIFLFGANHNNSHLSRNYLKQQVYSPEVNCCQKLAAKWLIATVVLLSDLTSFCNYLNMLSLDIWF